MKLPIHLKPIKQLKTSVYSPKYSDADKLAARKVLTKLASNIAIKTADFQIYRVPNVVREFDE